MGDHLTWERYYWFDNQVRTNRFPNASTLAEKFEISSKTAQRSIDFMRDRIGALLIPVILHFNSFRAQWIREQVWHPDQRMEDLPDGGLRLVLPVTDLREVKLRVLQFGADVEVMEPEQLRKEIREEIKKMSKIYEAG